MIGLFRSLKEVSVCMTEYHAADIVFLANCPVCTSQPLFVVISTGTSRAKIKILHNL